MSQNSKNQNAGCTWVHLGEQHVIQRIKMHYAAGPFSAFTQIHTDSLIHRIQNAVRPIQISVHSHKLSGTVGPHLGEQHVMMKN